MKNILIGVVVLVVLAGGFFVVRHREVAHVDLKGDQYGTDMGGEMGDMTDSAGSSTSTPTINVSASSSVSAVLPVGTVKTITVTGSNFAFDPKTITVNKGDTVKIVFNNSGGLHDFKIDEFNVATKKINGGQTDTVTFVADKTGSFEFYCSVGTHRQMGMKGTLIVK